MSTFSSSIFAGARSKKVFTATNAFQADHAWGRSELLDYKTPTGRRLQASLHYPAGYEPGRKYPMIVYNYELLSQNVHRYVAPSDREYYNISVFTSHGYFVLQPNYRGSGGRGGSSAQAVSSRARTVRARRCPPPPLIR